MAVRLESRRELAGFGKLGLSNSATHSVLDTLRETSDSDVSLLQGGSWWVLAKHTKGVRPLS